MAGTVHEVENHALLAEVEREAANAAQELVEAARRVREIELKSLLVEFEPR